MTADATTFSLGDVDPRDDAWIDTGDRAAVELLRDLVLAEYKRQNGVLPPLTEDEVPKLGDALQEALRRFAGRALEPGEWSARVVATQVDGCQHTYAKVCDTWVSPSGFTRDWAELVVEYAELTVIRDDTPVPFVPAVFARVSGGGVQS